MVSRHDLALARTRVLLADIAPEIPEAEIVPEARMEADLGLDVVSIWALATGLEKLAKVEIVDAAIAEATTIGDLMEHALSDVPLDYEMVDDGEGTDSTGGDDQLADGGAASGEQASGECADGEIADDELIDGEDLDAALADLANLFNS
ncbi:acyl carrier protein [Trueperella bialowiezensis]|uniref:Carrier domain-containing protein n=1 Tax=Trueperella bialowiezensis TaxID=312285 RepID=A0A3S4VS64_9ACTO|nr:hypothetical protein [Trueperella bialowiezensis]VEI12564.1 Uncharacterised protein [Trueperella bialowiezensis]